jgi:hypothetical protein
MSEVETFYREVRYLKDKFGLDHNCSIYQFASNLIKEIHRLEGVINNQSNHQGDENGRRESVNRNPRSG